MGSNPGVGVGGSATLGQNLQVARQDEVPLAAKVRTLEPFRVGGT